VDPGLLLFVMRLGIDLGTTRTVVAAHDRGNFPVVGFVTAGGDAIEHYPSVTAEVSGKLVHGFEAERAALAGAPALRSWKRLLGEQQADAEVNVGAVRTTLLDLASDFLSALRSDLATRSNLARLMQEAPEVVVSVPANAHSTQRFVTLEAFRRAGFLVRAMMNEPSAAGIEYAHRYRRTITARREHIVVYDLGGGTFDAALVSMAGEHHDVLYTSGVSRLGGDDFDSKLLDLALDRLGIDPLSLSPSVRADLLLECRIAKEGLHPNTRRISLDLAGLGGDAPKAPVLVPVADYYDHVRPLVERSLEALEPVLQHAASAEAEARAADARLGEPGPLAASDLSALPRGAEADAAAQGEGAAQSDALEASASHATSVAGIYVVGGGSGLPLVGRMLRDSFGRRVHRSAHPSAATAIGLAIAAADEQAPTLTERFTRHFGVFRELDSGRQISFDSIFPKGTPMPRPGEQPLVATRVYRAAHNIGLFRYVECSRLGSAREPSGDVTPHGTIRFPISGAVRGAPAIEQLPVERLADPGPMLEERYEVDASGVLSVTITELDGAFSGHFVL